MSNMGDCRNAGSRWPAPKVMRTAVMVADTGKVPFVDTVAAARYLAISPHSLECYRSLGGGPPFYKFGKFVRYAVADIEDWARLSRRVPSKGGTA